MGYAMPLMLRRGWNPSACSLALGVVWSAWHHIPLPVNGSHYNPAITGIIEALIALAVTVIAGTRRERPAVTAAGPADLLGGGAA
jgi:hypothetical protein